MLFLPALFGIAYPGDNDKGGKSLAAAGPPRPPLHPRSSPSARSSSGRPSVPAPAPAPAARPLGSRPLGSRPLASPNARSSGHVLAFQGKENEDPDDDPELAHLNAPDPILDSGITAEENTGFDLGTTGGAFGFLVQSVHKHQILQQTIMRDMIKDFYQNFTPSPSTTVFDLETTGRAFGFPVQSVHTHQIQQQTITRDMIKDFYQNFTPSPEENTVFDLETTKTGGAFGFLVQSVHKHHIQQQTIMRDIQYAQRLLSEFTPSRSRKQARPE